ncbi:MAG: hypothetical protein QGI83_23750, partial [Candidatus Latescibacteria bacterium]|nr:hypothetical protein [Candidatus Latescibacterota bacterium]
MSAVIVWIVVVAASAAVLLLVSARELPASETHPVYPVQASGDREVSLKRTVAPLMEMAEEEMVALVPDRTGFRFMGCPDCDEGTQEGQLDWSILDPHHVTCRYCGMVYPNEKYPEDGVLKLTNPVGVEVEYPYWEDETGYRYLFSARG